jgi:hypothetical protein
MPPKWPILLQIWELDGLETKNAKLQEDEVTFPPDLIRLRFKSADSSSSPLMGAAVCGASHSGWSHLQLTPASRCNGTR